MISTLFDSFFSTLSQNATTILMLIFFVIVAGFVKSPLFKGMFGEFVVNKMAKLMLDKNTYHLVKNITIPTADGTTQIDHVIVSKYGVFVIETKNMKGWIFGNPKQRQWTQKIYKKSFKFQNPIHQNYKHVKTLQEMLNLEINQVRSVIVFVGDSKFKTEIPENVTYGAKYISHIKSYTEAVLTDQDVSSVLEKIEEGRLSRSLKTNLDHKKHVKEIVKRKNVRSIG